MQMRHARRTIIPRTAVAAVVALLVAVTGCRDAPPPAPDRAGSSPTDVTLLAGATVIDPDSGRILPGATVVLRGATIEAVLPADETAGRPPGGRTVDLRGKFLMPGLIDTHAHVTVLLPPSGGAEPAYDRRASERVLRLLLAAGVTAARNPAAPTAAGVALRDAIAAGGIPGPRLRTSGEALSLSRAPYGPFSSVRTAAEVREEVRRQVQAGVDWIKVYSTLPPDLIQAAIAESHAAGVPVVGHLQRTTWTEAAELGIDGITHAAPWSADYLPAGRRAAYSATMLGRLDWLEHVDLDGPEIEQMVRELVRNRVTVDPTLIAFDTKFRGDDPAVVDPPGLGSVPPELVAYWRRGSFTADWSADDYARARALWPRLTALTRLLFDRGVTLTAGSDTPNPWVLPGLGLHEELRLLAEAGIPPLDVLRIATINGARALALDGDTGSLLPGKRADLLVLGADPLADIAHTRSVQRVILGGREFLPAALLEAQP